MHAPSPVRDRAGHALDQLRIHLAGDEGLVARASPGLVSGLSAGLAILAFRLLVESAQSRFLP